MNAQTQAVFGAGSKVIQALAHPSRLFMVDESSRGERCVCELKEMVGADMSTVSKHLSVLKSGVVGEAAIQGILRVGHAWKLRFDGSSSEFTSRSQPSSWHP